MVSKVLFESRSEEWGTPQALFNWLDEKFHFTLDPCASEANAKCAKFYTIEDDGLGKDWSQDTVFVNPPYGKHIAAWAEKCVREAQKGATVVMLVHARTDTRWWHDWAAYANEVWFLKGRVKFEGGKHSSTFPSIVLIFNPRKVTGYSVARFMDWKNASNSS